MKQRRPRLRELTNPESSHVRAYPEKDPNGALAVFEKGHKVAKFKRILVCEKCFKTYKSASKRAHMEQCGR